MTACPYCHRDEQGKPVTMDSAAPVASLDEGAFNNDLKELASADPFVRDQSVVRVAQRGFIVVPMLINVLNDPAKPGSAGVARSLGKIGDPRAIPVLAQAAKMGDENVRLAAVWALAQFHDPEVLPLLLSEAERPHPIIQSYLASILGTFQDARVVPLLGKLAGHPNREVAFQAAFALGETGDRKGIPDLQKSWRRRDILVRAASAASLRRLGAKALWMPPSWIMVGALALVVMGAGFGWFFYR
jgi:HEAT repeat protein